MKYDISNNPFDKEAYGRLLRCELYSNVTERELHSKVAENIRLKQELDNFKKKHDIPSAYPKSTFGLVYQECKVRPTFTIDNVLFNPPATIVFWLDGTKTVVKCKEGEEFSKWAGIALCLAKKMYGPNFHKIFKRHCSDPEKTVNDTYGSEIDNAVNQAFKGIQEASQQFNSLLNDFINDLAQSRKD